VPDNPDAWLLTAARNRLTDTQRRDARLTPIEDAPEDTMPDSQDHMDDARLKLMFVCAHPAIDTAVHTPLMLQTVLGFEAKSIASAFVTSPSAMAQRLVRAKSKIKAAAIAFALPEQEDRPARLSAVLEAIYGAYALDWLENSDQFSGEAQYLAEVLAHSMPDEPEVLGLVALIAFGRARDSARVSDGVLVPIEDQDTALWDDDLINLAAHALSKASKLGAFGRFQIEAAIQSVHAHRKTTGQTDWAVIQHLYQGLISLTPTMGAYVARAVAVGKTSGAPEALRALDSLSNLDMAGFQPYHAARAHFLSETGDAPGALRSYEKAISLTTDAPLRRYLEQRVAELR
jgi:RNA polymerase sigma-70 factor (ECF subfamily)